MPEHLIQALGADRGAQWQRNRDPYNPQVWMLGSPTGSAAALTSGRPNTRYMKLVDLWFDAEPAAATNADATAPTLLNQVIAASAARGDAWPHDQLRYYGQTTMFTCGAVAAMTALSHLGLEPFADTEDEGARERELAFWCSATNFPACEPWRPAAHGTVVDSADHRARRRWRTCDPLDRRRTHARCFDAALGRCPFCEGRHGFALRSVDYGGAGRDLG